MKTPQSRDELVVHLREQVRFLDNSARSYDEGFEGEAKRLAVVLRVLCHDTSNSRSLLKQLKVKESLQFHDVVAFDANDAATIFVGLGMGASTGGMSYRPKLNRPKRKLAFDLWWNGVVIRNRVQKIEITRREAVLSLADTDGGAHVDPKLDSTYAALSRSNAFGWEVYSYSESGVITPAKVDNSPALPIVRQTAHEVAGTIHEQLADLLTVQSKSISL